MDEKVMKYLFDIKEAAFSIESYLGEKRDFKEYSNNKMLRRAVEREFEIIGEAMNKIDKLDKSIAISGKRQIIGIRNRVIHSYDKIDNEIIWGVIIKYLPKLKEEVDILLS